MFYQQECHLQSAADLRDVARILLRQVERVDNREQKQMLAERAEGAPNLRDYPRDYPASSTVNRNRKPRQSVTMKIVGPVARTVLPWRPSVTPRVLAVGSAAFVRSEIISRSCSSAAVEP
jgi:hypothetical protein